jgi:2-oxoglutarate ferredoxin oxidoreductase subunit beta
MAALKLIRETEAKGEYATGILYIEPQKHDLTTLMNLVDEPLATLPLERVRPSRDVLDSIMESLK